MAAERTARTLVQMLAGAALSALFVAAVLWAGFEGYEASETRQAQQSEAYLVAKLFMRNSGRAKEAVGEIVRLDLRSGSLHAWPDSNLLAVYRIDVAGVNDKGEVRIEVENRGSGWEVVNAHLFMTDHRFVDLGEHGRQ